PPSLPPSLPPGLGLAFLRHIERCRIIIHVVDGSSLDPVGDLVAINQELVLFNPILASKPQVVALNKIDLPHVRDKVPDLKVLPSPLHPSIPLSFPSFLPSKLSSLVAQARQRERP
ncbi:gtp-binding protein obg, partial [Nannochloropsis gaditana]